MRPHRSLATALLIPWALVAVLAGCAKPTLVFGTATKFGLDASQRADQTVEVTMGYDRYEIASIPARSAEDGKVTDAKKTEQEDTYSVLGIFSVSYGNPFSTEPLVLRQFFATGLAARSAAKRPDFQMFFGHKSGEIINQGDTETNRNRTGAR